MQRIQIEDSRRIRFSILLGILGNFSALLRSKVRTPSSQSEFSFVPKRNYWIEPRRFHCRVNSKKQSYAAGDADGQYHGPPWDR